jgi:hypothetical protein
MTDDEERRRARPRRLTKKQDAAERGKDPEGAVGAPVPPEFPPEDPGWEPDPHIVEPWIGLIREHGREHRPNREDVLPYLLIRAFAPGDRARRPVWPPTPSWLSPDILLIDASWTGPFRADRVVANPTAGRTYRVFVHVWNLGLLAAAGVHVRAWHVDPGFFGGAPGVYTPVLIGGAFVDLAPRTAPGAHQIVEMQPPWPIPSNLTGHECLLAAADCPADRWNGILDANADRHVGQRNLSILTGTMTLQPLLATLSAMVGEAGFLEVSLESADPRGTIRYGVPIRGGQHLFVATGRGERLLILPTTQLVALFGEQPPDLSEAGTAARLFARYGRRAGEVLESGSLDDALTWLLDAGDLEAATVARALGGEGRSHTLHLAAFDRAGTPTGGYSVRIETKGRRQVR